MIKYKKPISFLILILISQSGFSYEFLDFPEKRPGYMGAVGCQTSMCHGGAGEMSKQFTIWKQAGPHSKSFATLTTAWSKRISDTLKIENPAKHSDCTSCHAPLAQVAPERLVSPLLIRQGVSCESCHGPSSEWLQSHTRTDYTHQQRVASGLTDQEDLYIRADTCVACHQEIAPEILAAGHPKLNYDLAALQNRLPRHWEEKWPDSQTWLVGQATSLREAAHILHLWQSESKEITESHLCQAQIQLMLALASALALETDTAVFAESGKNWKGISTASDEIAKELSTLRWTPELQGKVVNGLKDTHGTEHSRALAEAFLQLSQK